MGLNLDKHGHFFVFWSFIDYATVIFKEWCVYALINYCTWPSPTLG